MKQMMDRELKKRIDQEKERILMQHSAKPAEKAHAPEKVHVAEKALVLEQKPEKKVLPPVKLETPIVPF